MTESLDDAKGVVDRYKRFYRTSYLKSYLVGNRKQRESFFQGQIPDGTKPA